MSGEVAQGVAVEAAQVGRHDGDPGDAGGSRREQLGEVGAAPHEHDVGGVLEDPDELGLVAVRDRREDARHDAAAATPPGTGTRVMRAPRSTSATTSLDVLARHHDVDGPAGRGPGEHPVLAATRTTDTALERALGAGIRRQPDGACPPRAG